MKENDVDYDGQKERCESIEIRFNSGNERKINCERIKWRTIRFLDFWCFALRNLILSIIDGSKKALER